MTSAVRGCTARRWRTYATSSRVTGLGREIAGAEHCAEMVDTRQRGNEHRQRHRHPFGDHRLPFAQRVSFHKYGIGQGFGQDGAYLAGVFGQDEVTAIDVAAQKANGTRVVMNDQYERAPAVFCQRAREANRAKAARPQPAREAAG